MCLIVVWNWNSIYPHSPHMSYDLALLLVVMQIVMELFVCLTELSLSISVTYLSHDVSESASKSRPSPSSVLCVDVFIEYSHTHTSIIDQYLTSTRYDSYKQGANTFRQHCLYNSTVQSVHWSIETNHSTEISK